MIEREREREHIGNRHEQEILQNLRRKKNREEKV